MPSPFSVANSPITISITGDGTGAAGQAVANNDGYITDVLVTNPGTNYTYCNATITSTLGSGVTVQSPTSPIGGHGFDPISELGCSHVMIALDFTQSEGGLIPTDITYRQLGLILDAFSVTNASTTPTNPFATDDVYDITTHLFVSPGLGTFTSGQVIYQGPNVNEATYVAKIVSFDPATNVVRVINTLGTPTPNQAIIQDANGAISSAVRTLLSTTNPDFALYSGYMTYIENRTGVQRSADATEQFRLVLRF